MSAIIISCFPGCGKTYLCKNTSYASKIIDLDAADYTIQKEWPQNYFNAIIYKSLFSLISNSKALAHGVSICAQFF